VTLLWGIPEYDLRLFPAVAPTSHQVHLLVHR
jgi:hypothetical protein